MVSHKLTLHLLKLRPCHSLPLFPSMSATDIFKPKKSGKKLTEYETFVNVYAKTHPTVSKERQVENAKKVWDTVKGDPEKIKAAKTEFRQQFAKSKGTLTSFWAKAAAKPKLLQPPQPQQEQASHDSSSSSSAQSENAPKKKPDPAVNSDRDTPAQRKVSDVIVHLQKELQILEDMQTRLGFDKKVAKKIRSVKDKHGKLHKKLTRSM